MTIRPILTSLLSIGILLFAGGAAVFLERAAGDSALDSSQLEYPATQNVAVDSGLDTQARGIVGTKHDFSDGGRVPRDLCLPCHTQHITAAQAPLLVGKQAGAKSIASYNTQAGHLDAASLVCLSCHDGTVARDVWAGAHAMSWDDLSVGGLAPGRTRLTNHPVGVRYPDGERSYQSAASVTSDGRMKLPDGRIQCTTCHDPHNTNRHPGMLVISNDRSRLCLTCHRL